MLKRTSTQRHAQKTRNLTIPYSAIEKEKKTFQFSLQKSGVVVILGKLSNTDDGDSKHIAYFYLRFSLLAISVQYTDLCAVVVC